MRSIPTFLAVAAVFVTSFRARAQDPSPAPADGTKPQRSEIDDLRARLEELERRTGATPDQGIDLSGREVGSVATPSDATPLGRAWYENLDVWGYASFIYIDTGSVGEHPDGGFLLQEASIFAEAHVWEKTVLHAELRGAVVGFDFLSTGEIYADMQHLWSRDSGDFGSLRVGRFWVPFGDETIWFHAPQNPLISYSAAFPWGLDEGVELYGSTHGVDWIAAVTTGTAERNIEDGSAKTFNLKLSGKPCASLELNGNFMLQGATTSSALAFGGSSIDPVGSTGSSSAGTSPSSKVEGTLGELGAKVLFSPRASLGLTVGEASVDDPVDTFDRTFRWLRFEPRYDITPSVYAVLRYSEIGTYDSDEGYHFDGLGIADGGTTFGYDVQRFQRISGGIGWKSNPNTLVKLEVGRDQFWVIDGSPTDPDAGDRTYFALGLVVSF
jgi:hypothetical protein